ncbi:RNase adapter RapZ [Phytomonospora sp. NPDC050363]|uniref:RapZ C-terminal domain-containing protein n=1 Tax=Phytomonospora sp. NPDC050363 TaxID=3155642 RepID=UPI0033E103A8
MGNPWQQPGWGGDAGRMSVVRIVSFGFGHGAPPAADLVADLRAHFRDPWHAVALRALTGADEPVQAAVLATPGVAALVTTLAGAVVAMRTGPSAAAVTVALGCGGGRHRAPVVADAIAAALHQRGIETAVGHRDIRRPLLPPGSTRTLRG